MSPFLDEGNPDDSYGILKKVFGQQFEVIADQEVATRDPKDISAQSVRSPHDDAAHYRSKGDRQAKGHSANVTESCDDHDRPNLIAGISIKEAGTPGTDFLRPGMEKAQEVFTEQVEAAHADGAYHSPGNQGFCSENNIEMHLHAIQGNKGRYELEVDGEGENIVRIVDRKTDEEIPFEPITSKKGEKKRRIEQTKGYRYFTMKEVETALVRKKVADIPKGILQKRNNVEATIFQPAYHCSNGKTKYRGMIRHQMWADMRCLWVNFVRIKNYLISLDGEGASNELGKSAGNAFSFISIACAGLGGGFWSAFLIFSENTIFEGDSYISLGNFITLPDAKFASFHFNFISS